MSQRAEIRDRIARALVAHAARIAASDQADWIAAMGNELEHLPRSESALSWAPGSVFVSYTGRMRVMIRSSAEWPRWLLLLEILLCLGPATAYFMFVSVSIAQGYTLFPAEGYTPLQEVDIRVCNIDRAHRLAVRIQNSVLRNVRARQVIIDSPVAIDRVDSALSRQLRKVVGCDSR